MSAAILAKLQQGITLHQQGRLAEAAKLYEEVLQYAPTNFDALHLLGVIAFQTQRVQGAVELITKAIKLNPDIATAHNNLGSATAHNNLGNALSALKRQEQALASYDKAIALKPDYAEAHSNRGNALSDLKRYEEAIASYDEALALRPGLGETHYNRGNALRDLERYQGAIASYDKAITLKPDYADAYNNRGNALSDLKRLEEAIASYDKAIALKPDYAEAYNSRANVLKELRRYEEAISSYDEAIALKPSSAETHYNRGNALKNLMRHHEAIASYDKAIALKPDYAEAYNSRANVLKELRRYEEAISSLDKALALKPDHEFLLGHLIHTKMMICDWNNLETQIPQLVDKIDRAEKVLPPYGILAISDSPERQRKSAEMYILAKHPLNKALPTIPKRPRRDKIHIGYFSADFREHAVAFLAAGLFERHDRSKFEVTAFSIGPNIRDAMRHRLEVAFDKFIDVRDRSDRDAALLARKLEINIAVDLGGFTNDSRTDIFAMRAAPIQVNYLGYPGTMGAEFIDYIIADRILIADRDRKFYREKIVSLPHTYQVNDRKRYITEELFTRDQCGLPQNHFVFCCFNNNYKITPWIFDSWMRILRRVDGSVIWLLEDNKIAAKNLRKEAQQRGIDASRVIFAERMPPADHLARHRLADLFLDTLPYNAHTTASDALWAGLPVLTQIGETFAGRVAGSLLNAIDVPELITHSREEYEALAVELALNHEKLMDIKEKLTRNRLTTPLFDTALFARHIEAAYEAMYQRYQAGLPPDHIEIQPIK